MVIDCLRILFNGDDRSGVVLGVANVLLFLILGRFSNPLEPPSNRLKASCPSTSSFKPVPLLEIEAVISFNACLEAPTFLPLSKEDLGVKKRVKVLGVTVGFFFGFPLVVSWDWLEGKRGGDDGRVESGVEFLVLRGRSGGLLGKIAAIVKLGCNRSYGQVHRAKEESSYKKQCIAYSV